MERTPPGRWGRAGRRTRSPAAPRPPPRNDGSARPARSS